MRRKLLANLIFWLTCATGASSAAPPVELELATEQGVQITAPQEWLQLLAGIGIERVQIRGMRGGDEPKAENRGTAERPSYRVTGIVTKRGQLLLPGGVFTRGDRAKLKDFFDRLGADGAESLTAPRGRFGLTEKEMAAVLADLSQSIEFETNGQRPEAVIERLHAKFVHKFVLDGEGERILREAKPFDDELKGITAGTGAAMLLRNYGLIMRPEKSRGKAVVYVVEAIAADSIDQTTVGKTDSPDSKHWPIGWDPEKALGAIAPSLLESLNAEIGGYSLEEALGAIGPRLKVPLYVDHAALAAYKIEPAKVQVSLARGRMSYKRLLDRVLAQARLGCTLRVDENGKPFLWVTR
jgi:hypothetical protein